MKRIGFLYNKICSGENIRLAIRNSSKGKTNKRYIKQILENEDRVVLEIQKILIEKSYDFSGTRSRVIYDNSSMKERTITIPRYYPDQIIHWALIQVIQPVLTRGMYEFNCGSIPGRGGRAVKKYVDKALRRKMKYILKLDVKKFFPSVDHAKLKRMLARKIKDRDTLDLLYAIIDAGGEGLPIGFYTSQWLSNFYLQDLDHYIKEELHIKYYVRYVDDMVLIDTNKRKLHRAREKISDYLRLYNLRLKENWQLWRVGSRPLDFVGYRYYGRYIKLRKRLFLHLNRVVREIKAGGLNILRARRFTSLIGWSKRINFKRYYVRKIKPVISKKTATKYIGEYDKHQKPLSRDKHELALFYGIDEGLPDAQFYKKISEINAKADAAALKLASQNS